MTTTLSVKGKKFLTLKVWLSSGVDNMDIEKHESLASRLHGLTWNAFGTVFFKYSIILAFVPSGLLLPGEI